MSAFECSWVSHYINIRKQSAHSCKGYSSLGGLHQFEIPLNWHFSCLQHDTFRICVLFWTAGHIISCGCWIKLEELSVPVLSSFHTAQTQHGVFVSLLTFHVRETLFLLLFMIILQWWIYEKGTFSFHLPSLFSWSQFKTHCWGTKSMQSRDSSICVADKRTSEEGLWLVFHSMLDS